MRGVADLGAAPPPGQWPVRATSTQLAGPPGPDTAARPPVLLSDNSIVCHTTKCGSGTISSPRTWTLDTRESLLGGGRAASRDARAAGTGRATHFGNAAGPQRAGPRPRIGVVKSPRARGGCLGVIRTAGVEGCEKSGGAAQHASIPECPRKTRGTETSQYPEERKATATPSVAASERGPA